MPTNPDLLLLARAFVQQLVTLDQVSDLLREFERDESSSLSLLLKGAEFWRTIRSKSC